MGFDGALGWTLRIYKDEDDLNRAIARLMADEIERQIAARGLAVVLFDSDPELAGGYGLLSELEIAWTRVIGFQLAEWRVVGGDDRRAGRKMLLDRLVRRVAMAEFHSLRGEAANPEAVCSNYEALLSARCDALAPLVPLVVIRVDSDGRRGSPPLPETVADMALLKGPLKGPMTPVAGHRSKIEIVSGEESIGLTWRSLLNFERIALIGDLREAGVAISRLAPGDETITGDGPFRDTYSR